MREIMNREIIFRGKRIDNGEWIEGYYVVHNLHVSVDKERQRHIIIPNNEMSQQQSVHPESVGQYTGLKDKNGKMIFEGDILKCSVGKNDVVIFSKGCFYLRYRYCSIDHYENELHQEVEVIGNLIDNPQNMKQKLKKAKADL